MLQVDDTDRRKTKPKRADLKEQRRQAAQEKEYIQLVDTPLNKRKMYDFRKDDIALRKAIEPLLVAAIDSVLGGKSLYLIKSSTINHTGLQPDGDLFSINFVIEVHEKPDANPKPDVSANP